MALLSTIFLHFCWPLPATIYVIDTLCIFYLGKLLIQLVNGKCNSTSVHGMDIMATKSSPVFYSDQSEVHNSLNLNPYDLTNPRLQPKKNSSSVPSSSSFSKSCETYFYKWTRNKITSVSGSSEDYDRALKENHLTHEDATKLGPAPLSVKLKRWRMGKMKLYSDLPRTTEGFKNKLDLAK